MSQDNDIFGHLLETRAIVVGTARRIRDRLHRKRDREVGPLLEAGNLFASSPGLSDGEKLTLAIAESFLEAVEEVDP